MVETRNYHILTPLASHWRPATCAEVDCKDYERGWMVRLPRTDEERLRVLRSSGRDFVETTAAGDSERTFVFEPGQPCFRAGQHRKNLERPAIHVIRDGRAQPRKVGPQQWHDDLGGHLDHIRAIREKG